MKINNDSSKNAFLIFNDNKNPNLKKRNTTKIRADEKFGLLNNDDLQEFGFNNALRTNSKPSNYPMLNMPKRNTVFPNSDQFNLNYFLNQIENGDLSNNRNSLNSGKNINFIFYAPNYIVNKKDNEKNDEMESGHKMRKTEYNINLNPSNEKNKKKDECPSNNQKNKKLFDSNFNLLENECENDELSQILKEFVHLSLDTPIKKDSRKSNNDDNTKNYINTGDSVNCFRCEANEKRGNNRCSMDNPYSKVVYKK